MLFLDSCCFDILIQNTSERRGGQPLSQLGSSGRPKLASIMTTNILDSFPFDFLETEHFSCDKVNWFPYGRPIYPTIFLRLFNISFLLDCVSAWIICLPKLASMWTPNFLDHFSFSFFFFFFGKLPFWIICLNWPPCGPPISWTTFLFLHFFLFTFLCFSTYHLTA